MTKRLTPEREKEIWELPADSSCSLPLIEVLEELDAVRAERDALTRKEDDHGKEENQD